MPELTVARLKEISKIFNENKRIPQLTFTFPLSEEMIKAGEEDRETIDAMNKIGLKAECGKESLIS